MTSREICLQRSSNQRLVVSRDKSPAEVVGTLVAMQAQDYLAALWSIGVRLAEATEADVEKAIADRTIVRTWVMRGTLHFVAAADVRWMLELLTPRVIARNLAPDKRRFGLDETVLRRCRNVLTRALGGGNQLTRDDTHAILERAKISTGQQRGYHILWRLAQEGLICGSARIGRQPAFALLEEWVPAGSRLDRASALTELAKRYFRSHGPATLNDFAGWSGLTTTDARSGLEGAQSMLSSAMSDGKTYWFAPSANRAKLAPTPQLLPAFDEYLLGYKDRTAMLDPRHTQRVIPGTNGMFLPSVLLDGRVAGTWKRTLGKNAVEITVDPFVKFARSHATALERAAGRYGKFLGLPVKTNL